MSEESDLVESTEIVEAVNDTHKNLNLALAKNKVFDPRILDDSDTSRVLWTTESVKLADIGLKDGFKLRENPYHKTVRDANLRKGNIPFDYSPEELEVFDICMEDKEFYADNFGKLKDGDKGWVNIKLRDYQRNLLSRYAKNAMNIVMFPRQSGKTTTTIVEICHFLTFNFDKDCVVIAQSDKVVNEILTKIKEFFHSMPFFLQPGFISFTKKGLTLDNGCRLSIGIASESVVQGFSLDLLYIDEYAYIKPSMVRKFWSNIYPTLINNPNSRCIITSTPNGRNMFYELWTAAERGDNKFKSYRIYWYDVPRAQSHDEFKAETIANIGIEGWEMGFECSFDTQLKSIFRTQVQKTLRKHQLDNEETWSMDNNPIGNKYGIEFISQKVVQYDLKKDYFIAGIDIGEGLEQDASTLKIKKIDWNVEKKKLEFVSIGIFKSNIIAVDEFAQLTMDISKEFTAGKLRVVVENNTYGGEFFNQVKSLKLFNADYHWFDSVIFAKFIRQSKDDYEYGIRWNMSNKKLGVKSFASLISNDSLIETHPLSIEEYLNFGRQKNGSYAAQYGHDDLVMADVSISHFIKCNNMYSEEFIKIAKEDLRLIKNDEPPEVLLRKAEEERKKNNTYKTDNGFTLRDHAAEVKKLEGIDSDIYLMMVQ